MTTFKYNFCLQAQTEKEADTKMEALKMITSKLSATELQALAEIVQKRPDLIATAKEMMGVK